MGTRVHIITMRIIDANFFHCATDQTFQKENFYFRCCMPRFPVISGLDSDESDIGAPLDDDFPDSDIKPEADVADGMRSPL